MHSPLIKLKKRKYENITYPTLPYKRELDNREYSIIRQNFGSSKSPEGWHSWSQIDANGHILLSDENSVGALWYVTEEDLSPDLEWKACDKFGSFYKVVNETIKFKPMMKNGSLSKEDDEDDVILEAFSPREQLEFFQELKKIFGEEIKECYPINKFEIYEII